MRVLIVEVDNKADRHEIIFQVIHETAATGFHAQRPTHSVRHLALLVILRLHFPQLFHAQSEFLWLTAF